MGLLSTNDKMTQKLTTIGHCTAFNNLALSISYAVSTFNQYIQLSRALRIVSVDVV